MKKYIALIAFCLIYYWPIELPAAVLGGIAYSWYYIKKKEAATLKAYTAIPGPCPTTEPVFIEHTDYIATHDGRIMEFSFNIHYHTNDQ